jgi:hypothetical protein
MQDPDECAHVLSMRRERQERERQEEEFIERHERLAAFEDYQVIKDKDYLPFTVFYEIWKAVREYRFEVHAEGRTFGIHRDEHGVKIEERT